MKKTILPLAAVMLIAGCSLQGISGDGNIVTENRSAREFSVLDASGGFTIRWTNGQPALTIRADSNLLPHIKSEINGDTLHIYCDTQTSPTKDIEIAVAGESLTAAHLAGAIQFVGHRLSGKAFDLKSAGAVAVTVDGTIDDLKAGLSGACGLKATGLQVKTAELDLTGASGAEIDVSDMLKVSAIGACSVKYAGNPKTIEKNLAGASTLEHLP